jgi:hypothetical protein
VNPKLGVKARREELRAWGFGRCRCVKCVEEEKSLVGNLKVDGGRYEIITNTAGGGEEEREERERRVQNELDEMVRELKAGLGVV